MKGNISATTTKDSHSESTLPSILLKLDKLHHRSVVLETLIVKCLNGMHSDKSEGSTDDRDVKGDADGPSPPVSSDFLYHISRRLEMIERRILEGTAYMATMSHIVGVASVSDRGPDETHR